MTLRSAICSRFFALCVVVIMPSIALASTVTGAVRLSGSHEESVIKQGDYSGVVIWLRHLTSPADPVPPRHAQMVQKNKRFTPHVLAISVGSTVDFPNFDPIFHNAFSNFSGQLFDIGLYPPGSTRSIRFTRPGIVQVFCNIHSTMSAVIVVLDSPYFTTTGKDGKFALDGLTPGSYELHVVHERASPETLNALVQTVQVTSSGLTLPVIQISEAGYLTLPHKNKYGRDYPAVPEDQNHYLVQ